MTEEKIDLHAHIIPGVDDGARSLEEARIMLEMAAKQGFSSVIATPHFRRDLKTEELRAQYSELEKMVEKEIGVFRLSLGQEILYFEDLPLWLEEGRALSLAGSRYVLVEFNPEERFSTLIRASRSLEQAGYRMIAAHVERYACLRGAGRLKALWENGALLQMNYSSLEGGVLDREMRWCRRQVLEGRIHFLATDMHRSDWRAPRTEAAERWLHRRCGTELCRCLMRDNAKAVLDDCRLIT